MTAIGDVQALQTLAVYTSDVNSVDFAGDCILVTGSGDKRVRVWEWQPGTGYVEAYFSPLMGHKYGVTSVKVSPQSTMLATSSIDGTTLLWNLRTGTKIHTMVQVGGEAVRVCRFSPDSTLLATAGDNGQVCIWDLVHRNLIRCFQKHEGAVQSLSFSPDSSWLITSCTLGVLKLFSTAELIDTCTSSNQDIVELVSIDDAHDMGVVCCDFSTFQEVTCNEPYTKLYQLVSCGNDHDVKLWEVTVSQNKCEAQPSTATIQLCRVMEKHSSALTCVRFSSNGLYIASCGLDKTAVIWETSSGKVLTIISGHNRYIACCAFSRDGSLLATGSNDKSVIAWDLTGNLTIDSELSRNIGTKWFVNDPEKSTMHEQDVMRNVETYANEVRLIQRLEDHYGAVNSVAFHGNNLLASASGDKLVRMWSVEMEEEDGEEVIKILEKPFSPLDAHTYSVNYVEFSPCGSMLASCSLDGTTLLWNTENGEQAKSSFVNSGTGIRVCRWTPDGMKIATAGDDEKTTLWDVENMDQLQYYYSVFEGHADAISAIAFTHDSRYLVTACNEGTWRLFDTLDEKNGSEALLVCDASHDLGVQGCDFSPTPGSLMCSASRDTDVNQQIYLLATCGNDSLVKLWHIIISNDPPPNPDSIGSSDIGTRYKEKKSLTGHGGNVMCVCFSPVHGEVLGSVATDRTARIWSVFSGSCLYVLEDHDSLVTSCAFSEDTSFFVTGALDKTVLIWKIPQQLVSQNNLMDSLRNKKKRVTDWKVYDTLKWLNDIELSRLSRKILGLGLTGRHLLSVSENELISRLEIEDDKEAMEILKKQLYWLKREDCNITESIDESEIPHEFLCPITHEIMKEPVQCSDGFTYERAAINEWFLCGKYTSPMTNEPLHDTSFTPNFALRNAILTLLHGEGPQ
ncbi:WD repeat, SAM and U-box domain-containing protein 1-like isoform X1 [Pogonomyrmex barbatus]|uniref:WD repeat, SAM and U-box domain-containing protein 1-like isoform X1 n=1 Tax=Pogonomyrmex barbatus TaxID=144034 RepID=A0A6I9VSM0_9HYME|nr:WD repeat, SAM and U-box domain-containing protein 1-like isoform X1 [Pogonomyrmex barbatus]XP_011630778.1 WD repeat, SAM and U-box domain-containing protein 1-like isoform X1 [Pogonomyrmex barbatus]XP_011630780.1 WD repeat, SAM and U-box domain-containing protein 1-like isoform X1 [Pogonomyrmex barbatus]XP_011630781.1 WD repeat, SAM and U-box domain-containing protein 1-like isoform X1 [Pogonomyrmex barbatus]